MNRRRVLTIALATPLAALAPTQAWGYFGVGSTGVSGVVAADSLPAPTVSLTSASASSVKLAVAAGSGLAPGKIEVDRTAPTAGLVCADASAGSCTDSSPMPGVTNTYVAHALLGTNWTTASAALDVNVPTASLTYSVSAATTTIAAGTAFSVTVNANQPITGSQTVSVSGASNSPAAQPVLPTTASFGGGRTATVSVTLVKPGSTTLNFTVGGVSAGSVTVTVTAGVPARLAWTNPVATGGTLGSPCLFTCTLPSLGGNGGTFKANVSVTDSDGNIVSGAGGTVSLSTTGGTLTATTVTIPSTGAATSGTTFTVTSQAGSWSSDTVTASLGTYTSATATLSK
jgi:hypothetical protein